MRRNLLKKLLKSKKSDNSKEVNAGEVDLSLPAQAGQATNLNQENTQTTNPWFLFFTALAITIISAFVVLIIKLKFQKNVRT